MAATNPAATGASFNLTSAPRQAVATLPPDALRIYNEYLEMPGMQLTRQQAERMWGLEPARCQEVLEHLVHLKFLYCTPGGQYARLTDGAFSLPPVRMAKAELEPSTPSRLRA